MVTDLLERAAVEERSFAFVNDLLRTSRRSESFADWIEANLVMPSTGVKRAGPLKLEDWQREPANALLDPSCRAAVFMWHAQSLKTTLTLARFGYSILERQETPLLVASTQKALKRFVQLKLDKMMETFPALSAELQRNRKESVYFEDGLYSVRRGKVVEFDTSGAKSGMKSVSAGLVGVEEYEDFSVDASEASNPFDMLLARGEQMIDPLLILPSTPSQQGESLIDDAFHRSDARERYVKCLHCHTSEPQMLTFGEHVIKDPRGRWHYYCPSCGQEITEEEKRWIISDAGGAEWMLTNADANAGFYGWHINMFHSDIHTIQDVMEFYTPNSTAGFLTQRMAIAFSTEEAPKLDESEMMELHREFPDETPFCRTVGADTQTGSEPRFEASLIDWYGDWVDPIPCILEHVIIPAGDKEREQWEAAMETLRDYHRNNKADITMLDVGCNKGEQFVKSLVQGNWRGGLERGEVRCIKGQGIEDSRNWINRPVLAKDRRSDDTRPPDETISIHTDISKNVVVKEFLHRKILRLNVDTSKFPVGYHAQLASEWLQRVLSGTIEKLRWRKKPRQRNEALDCFNYGYAGMLYLGPNFKRRGKVVVSESMLSWALGTEVDNGNT